MNRYFKKKSNLFLLMVLIFSSFSNSSFSQEDHSHYSETFNREKSYRIFLPDDYANSQKRYPVIYYFHGNNGSHKLNYEGATELVNDNEVILVAWNGRSIDSNHRPYNIGNHSNIRYEIQFKDYFLEFINHIDSTYRTINDRSYRAVFGHSMGGIMSFYLAAKYPDLIGTSVNSKGSPEFFIGYPDNHSLYHVRHTFKNLYGVRLLFTNSTTGELVNLNNEVNYGAQNVDGLDYEYKIYNGGHSMTSTQFKDGFNFIVSSFTDPLPDPLRWNHDDLYPNFDIWAYEVRSNLSEPGYIEMKGVTKSGMGIRTKKWQPDGRLIPGVTINVKTSAIYSPATIYTLLDHNITHDITTISEVLSDAEGKICFSVNHENHQIGISKKGSSPAIVFTDYKVNGEGIFFDQKKECNLQIRLLNRGGSKAKNLMVKLTTSTKGVTIDNPSIKLRNIPAGELKWVPSEFKITAKNPPTTDGSPFRIKFKLVICDGDNQVWNDEFEAPVYYDVPEFTNIGIDDGDTEIFGSGNGDNIAQPGEDILVYEISNGSHRTRLYYDDPYIDNERLYSEIQPDKWGDGYTLSSIIHIADNCPPGHRIKFLASYEIKEWKTIKRNVTWGTFSIIIGDDNSSSN